jgi:hypothetical protein
VGDGDASQDQGPAGGQPVHVISESDSIHGHLEKQGLEEG